jgi:thiol-disulfide isomerase/thioredoxin
MKNLFLFSLFFLGACTGCTDSYAHLYSDIVVKEFEDILFVEETTLENDSGPTKENFVHIPPILLQPIKFYPPEPHSVEKFHVMPNMTFYDPWSDEWVELQDYYLSKDVKALFIVSSAGWCGPCLMEAAALIGIYEKYHEDGLEIIYTLGNTNVPGDVPFETSYDKPDSADFSSDVQFMENWKHMASTEAGKYFNYPIYADPKREFLPYKPNHAWPLSMLVTTKDMGVRLVEEGFWSALVENKIEMVLYSDVPNIPLE